MALQSMRHVWVVISLVALAVLPGVLSAQQGIQPDDLYRLQSVGEVQLAPDGRHLAYTVQHSDRPGQPYSQARILELATGESWRLGTDSAEASGARWSPDGQRGGLLRARR